MFVVSTPVGENLTRLRSVVFPVMLMTAFLARFRPRWLTAMALSAALVYNVAPYAGSRARPDRRAGRGALVLGAGGRLPRQSARRRTTASRSSRPSTTGRRTGCPRAGVPLARGWYRQIDIARNELFYEKPLAAAAYREWLRGMGVRFVVLPSTRLGQKGEEREAALLRSGASGLRRGFPEPAARDLRGPAAGADHHGAWSPRGDPTRPRRHRGSRAGGRGRTG